MVRTFKLSDGKTMPAMSYGMMQDPKKSLELAKIALKHDIYHLDGAQVYRTEAEMGEAIKELGIDRNKVFVTTKIFTWKDGNPPASQDSSKIQTTPEDITSSVQNSVKRIGFIPDLMLIHNPHIPEKGQIGKFWQILEGLVEDGTLKGCSLGVSNFRPQDLEEVLKVCKIRPVVNQLEYHPYVAAHLDPVLALQAKNQILTQAYSPLTPLRHPGKTGGPLKPVLTKIASTLSKESNVDVDEAMVLLLWVMGKGAVAISGSGRESNIQKMADTEKVRDLSKEEMKEIDEVGRKVHYRAWLEHMTTDYPSPNLPEDI